MHGQRSPGRDAEEEEDVGTDRTHPLPCNPGRTWKAVAEHRMHSAVATIALLIIVPEIAAALVLVSPSLCLSSPLFLLQRVLLPLTMSAGRLVIC